MKRTKREIAKRRGRLHSATDSLERGAPLDSSAILSMVAIQSWLLLSLESFGSGAGVAELVTTQNHQRRD